MLDSMSKKQSANDMLWQKEIAIGQNLIKREIIAVPRAKPELARQLGRFFVALFRHWLGHKANFA